MLTLFVRNPHDAIMAFCALLKRGGVAVSAGITMPMPLTTVFDLPLERVHFWESLGTNPFFHFFEALRRAGSFYPQIRDTLPPNLAFLKGYGLNLNLMREPLQQSICLRTSNKGFLDAFVTDPLAEIISQAYVADFIFWSMLHELVSKIVDVPIGRLYHITYEAYVETGSCSAAQSIAHIASRVKISDNGNPYRTEEVRPFPLINTSPREWYEDFESYRTGKEQIFHDRFFISVALPLRRAYKSWTDSRLDDALDHVAVCAATDWRLAAKEWLERQRK